MSPDHSQPSQLAILTAICGGEYAGHWGLWTKSDKRTKFFTDAQIEDLSKTATKLSEKDDVYMCMSSQEEDVGPHKRGSIDTVTTVFAFAGDIDIADEKDSGKNYPSDRETALAILETFEHPHTYLQDSGRGLHVVWGLETPIRCENRAERRRAQSLSKAFQKKLVAHFKTNGFEIDSVGDITRVIRVPYTLNHSVDPPAPVIPLFFEPTVKLSDDVLDSLVPETTRSKSTDNPEARKADHNAVKKGCGWYDFHTGDGAASSSEPNWHAALGITARCRNADKHAHDYSAKYSDYDEAETSEKLERVLTEAGPRTCAAIESDLNGAQFCSGCPNQGQITSPIQLGYGYDPGKIGPIAIGYMADGSFVLRDQVRDIMIVQSSGQLLNFQTLLGLAPSEFWARQYPKKGKMFDALGAGEDIIKACKQAGPFVPSGIRGLGLWLEGDRIIENFGNVIPEWAEQMYLCFNPLPLADQSLVPGDVERIHDLLREFPWRHRQDAIFLLGWLMLAPMCGALNWRPHIFLFGPANSGKTTLHNFSSKILAPLATNADGSSSSAGIRQKLGPDARPVLIDEFETDQDHRRLQAITSLARSASSADSRVLKGTPEGKAMEFAIKAIFMFSAINVGGRSQADDSRIINLELTAHDSDKDTGRRIAATISDFEAMGPAWCRFVADHAAIVIETISILKIEMPPMDSRHALNMATLLAGAYVALNQATPTAEQAQVWVQTYLPAIERHAQAHERNDAMECWNYLIAQPIRGNEQDFPLGHWLSVALDEMKKGEEKNALSDARRILAMHNMRIILDGDYPGLMIANGSPPMDALFKDTKWAKGAWKPALGQILGVFSPPNPIRIPGMSQKPRCVGVPLTLIPDRIDFLSGKREF